MRALPAKYQLAEFHTQSKRSDRSGGAQRCSGFFCTEGSHWLRALPAKYQFAEFHAQSKRSDRSGGTQWRFGFFCIEGSHWQPALPAKKQDTPSGVSCLFFS